MRHKLTRTAELAAFNLRDAFVSEPTRTSTASAAGLDGVCTQEVSQPLDMTVADEGVLGQVPDGDTAGVR